MSDINLSQACIFICLIAMIAYINITRVSSQYRLRVCVCVPSALTVAIFNRFWRNVTKLWSLKQKNLSGGVKTQ